MDVVFIDANVLFSAAYRDGAGVTRLWDLVEVDLVTSAYAADEARRNLPEPEHRARLEKLLGRLRVETAGIAYGLPFHFREAKGLEVDHVLEQGDRVVAVEAKSAATVASDFFTALQRLGKDVAARLPHVTYEPRLVYGGDEGQRRSVASVIPWAEIHDARW